MPLIAYEQKGLYRRVSASVKRTPSGHVVLVTESSRGHARSAVSFSQCDPQREEIFTITEVEGGYSGFNFMTGTVISPSCYAVDLSSRKTVPESKRKFALTCPAGSPLWVTEEGMKLSKRLILGAAVFDLEGSLIGTICSLDEKAYDLKFARQARHWVHTLEAELKAKDGKILLSKKARKPGPPSGTEKEQDGTKKRKLEDYDQKIDNLVVKGSSVCHFLTI